MSFNDHLQRLSAAEIAEALGCPLPTAYDYRSGRRQPPDWQHPHWIAILEKYEASRDKASQKKPKKSE